MGESEEKKFIAAMYAQMEVSGKIWPYLDVALITARDWDDAKKKALAKVMESYPPVRGYHGYLVAVEELII